MADGFAPWPAVFVFFMKMYVHEIVVYVHQLYYIWRVIKNNGKSQFKI